MTASMIELVSPEAFMVAAAAVRSRLLAEGRVADPRTWKEVGRTDQQMPQGDWRTWLILAGRGWGKALALDTPLPTPAGWTTMGDVVAGDQLMGADGMPVRVSFVTDVQIGRPCYNVRFSDGAAIVADGEHRWFAASRADRRAGRAGRVVTTAQMLAAGLTVAGERRWRMPVARAFVLPEAELSIDPWVLGFWLGDGSSAGSDITIGDQDAHEVAAQFAAAGEPLVARGSLRYAAVARAPVRDVVTGRMAGNGSLRSRLREAGLLQNKHIPGAYLRASRAQREALLAGLLDSDGWIEHVSGRAEIITISRRLSEDVAELVRSLGHRVRIGRGEATIGGRIVGPKYRLAWVMREAAARLERKRLANRRGLGQPDRITSRMVVAIEPIPSVPVRCLTVDAPDGLFLAGREMLVTHNTRTGAEAIHEWVRKHKAHRIALVAQTAADARDIMIEGPLSGLLATARRGEMPRYEPTKRRLTWPNGAVATAYSAEDPDSLRGPQFDTAWADELAAWRYPEAYDQLQFGLRLGWARQIITTTPRPTRLVRELRSDPTAHVTVGRTMDNAANLAPSFLATIRARYEGTRLGRQELDAELLEDILGAAWQRGWIEMFRIQKDLAPTSYLRVVVAVDPADSAREGADDTGIIVTATASHPGDTHSPLAHEHYYVLADATGHMTPDEWGQAAVAAYKVFGADALVIETNRGAEMVERVVRSVDPNVHFKAVHATRGKITRAEPVAALYEQGKVHHVGSFPQLEDQMCEYVPAITSASPDRMDALVWALTELAVRDEPSLLVAYRQAAAAKAAAAAAAAQAK